jgi:hypothetical protein
LAVTEDIRISLVIIGGYRREGGLTKPKVLNDVHCFDCDFNLWEPIQADGHAPPPRHGHTAVLVPSLSEEATREDREHSSIVVFGGAGEDGLLDDLHLLSLKGKLSIN